MFPFVDSYSILEFVHSHGSPNLVSEYLAYADRSTPGFLLLSPTSNGLGAIRETPLVDLSVAQTCLKEVNGYEKGEVWDPTYLGGVT